MAKDTPPPSPESYSKDIDVLRQDIKGITGFLSQEFIKLVNKYEGVIDVSNQDFRIAAQSLIHADPNAPENAGRPVLSFTGTQQGIEKRIKQLEGRGVPPEVFTELLQEMASAKKELSTQISTNEGIKSFIEPRLKNQIIENNIGFFTKTGMGMSLTDKKGISNLVVPHITLSENSVQQMIKGDKIFSAAASAIVNREISEAFGTKNGETYEFDKAKLTPENIAKVGKKISDGIEAEGMKLQPTILATALVSDVIKQMEKEQKVKFTPERVEKITKALVPTLAKLGPEYIEKNKGELTQELATSLKSGQSYSTSFTGNYTVSTSELGKVASKMEKQHQPKAETASVKKIESIVFKRLMTNEDIAKKLNSFAKATGMTKDGKPLTFDAKFVPDTATIAKMRQSNPKKFDGIFDTPRPPHKPSPDLVKQVNAVVKKGPTPPPKPKTSPPPRKRSGAVVER